jgi:DNA invertase Pin-like site-specific DNA recombinase
MIGYARVSRVEQNLDLQKDALRAAGCTRIFEDKMTGSKFERDGLAQALDYLREGDTFVVWRLDRLGRSMTHLIETVHTLEKGGIMFKSVCENLDTTTATGTLTFHILAALAEFERNLIRQRTHAGLQAAHGHMGGRKKLAVSNVKVRQARLMHDDKTNSVADICMTLNISKTTLYRWLARAPQEEVN